MAIIHNMHGLVHVCVLREREREITGIERVQE